MQGYYLSLNPLDPDNRINGWSAEPFDGAFFVELEDYHELLTNPFIYKIVNDKLVRDDEYQEELIEKENEPVKVPTEILGQQITDLEIKLLDTTTDFTNQLAAKDAQITSLGQSVTSLEIAILEMEAGADGTESEL
ncbi:hypothetical protein ABG775_02960 [Peribacillus simplex]|uniref:hypothetical protein n=1 Tax=Peribacillus simplex TaxID=1478 RepID=UPI0033920059